MQFQMKRKNDHQGKKSSTTLFVSDLRRSITENDLYTYFTGSIYVVLKQCHVGKSLQYNTSSRDIEKY